MSYFQKTSITDKYRFDAEMTPMGEQRFIEPVRLCGQSFGGPAVNTNFWTVAASGTGASVSQANSQMTLTSGTSASSVTAYTVQPARYVGGASMRYRGIIQLDAGTANNTRRWGIGYGASLPTITDGAFFQLSGTTFSVVTMKNSVATTVTSFNGDLGASYSPGTNAVRYEIYYTNTLVIFTVADSILHTVTASSDTWASVLVFHAFHDSTNSDVATSVNMNVRVSTIYKLGRMMSAPIYKYITGAVTAQIINSGPGMIHNIILGDLSANPGSMILYDAKTATNPIYSTSWIKGAQSVDIPIETNYFVGLTVTTTGAGNSFTFIFE